MFATTTHWPAALEDRDLSRAAAEHHAMLQAADVAVPPPSAATVLGRLFCGLRPVPRRRQDRPATTPKGRGGR